METALERKGTLAVRDAGGKALRPEDEQADFDKLVPEDEGLDLVKEGKKRRVRSCPEWDAAHEDGYEVQYNVEAQSDATWQTRCKSDLLLRDAIASDNSYVGDVELDAAFPKIAPPTIAGIARIGPQEWFEGLELATGKTWADIETVKLGARLDPDRWPHSAQYEAPGWSCLLTVLGYGDVDGDGLEDVLVKVIASNQPDGHWISAGLIVLTRDSSRSPLREIRTR